MPNDIVPPPTGSWLSHLNLPEILAGPAGKAISRLIGEAVDIPAAKLQSYAQGIRDQTEARSTMSRALATAAAQQAIADRELISRAANSFLKKELRAQANKEAIAEKTVKLLEAPSPSGEEPSAAPVEDDWLNVFERFAEDASSARLQDIWAQILAGQIRKPKSFSLRTLRFVAELDEEVVALFEELAPSIVDNDFVPYPARSGDDFTKLLRLEEAGLVNGSSGSLHKSFVVDAPMLAYGYKTHTLIFMLSGPANVQLPASLLTQVGKQIYKITQAGDRLDCAQKFADSFPKENVKEAIYVGVDPTGSSQNSKLWVRPSEVKSENAQ